MLYIHQLFHKFLSKHYAIEGFEINYQKLIEKISICSGKYVAENKTKGNRNLFGVVHHYMYNLPMKHNIVNPNFRILKSIKMLSLIKKCKKEKYYSLVIFFKKAIFLIM